MAESPIMLTFAFLGSGLVLLVVLLRMRRADRIRGRLDTGGYVPPEWSGGYRPPATRLRVIAVPGICGLVAVFAARQATGSVVLAAAAAIVAGIAGYVVMDAARARRELALEERLADALDLVVSALRAGVSLLESLEAAATEATGELKAWLQELTGRLRLGDRPAEVFPELAAKLPLESFRLFSFILAVQWDAGGSLASTLGAVARSIRDRLEVVRRVKAQAAESQFSVIGILLIVYIVAILLGRSDPERMRGFLSWTPGVALASAAILLQAVGLVWIRRLSDIRV